MKNLFTITLIILFVSFFQINAIAQEKHGSTLNLGVGIGGYGGYYKYANSTLPVININYEFDVAKDFTLAPFVSFSTYAKDYYRDNNNTYYTYRETIIPIGVKGTYYFDDIFQANKKWDFYLAGSVGFAVVNTRWADGYEGDKNYYRKGNPLFLDLHIGTEYHFNNKVGAFLDLSTGVSTIGLAIH
ncbi:hypothetical protein ACSX1A_06120 [Pontibacter sp. MBLB2868]|uniref:hypothetical protein n=1 Tax=Pontibacter sp. MBLB2868 TaxID=3451555 RepID=UPI003F74E968